MAIGVLASNSDGMGIPGKVDRWVSGWEGGMSRYVRCVLVVCCY